MMKRSKSATLPAIVTTTVWQKHTVRGFVIILASKGGEKIESSKNSQGERTYARRRCPAPAPSRPPCNRSDDNQIVDLRVLLMDIT